MKIVNSKRFKNRLIVMLMMLVLINIMVSSYATSSTQLNYIEYTIAKNDTLWLIANIIKENSINYYNKDVREIIYEIKQINKMTTADIYENQIILIPEI